MKKTYREMGLTDLEYERIKAILGREPNTLETGMFAVMWSEHCSYKHSKPLLRLLPNSAPWVLQGPGENAGVIDIGDGWAIAFKMESHNHPSAIEPFQGAATGVGGIVRDIFAMGARPIALLDSLRFGPLTGARVKYLFLEVVRGISWYGNCLGIPTVGGETIFDTAYTGNPLVNVMCVGLLRHEELAKGVAAGPGNPVMLVGAKTGRDGIHGATFASAELDEGSAERRPAVQVGDPFTEKMLLEACLELIRQDLVLGMQDLGAAGLTGAASEMASRGNSGLELDVSLVPRREKGMTPFEVMLSESQERMLLVPRPGCQKQVEEIFAKWGLAAAVVGRVTGDGLFRIKDGPETVAEVPAKALTEMCPLYGPPEGTVSGDNPGDNLSCPEPPEPADYGEALLALLADPNLADKVWVYRQYDYQVGTNTVLGPGSDAAVIRIKGTNKAVALITDCNGNYCYLDPFAGAVQAVAEAARNLLAVGARPLAVTDCLNFGNPEKPSVYRQLEQCIRGIREACLVLQTPVVSGNVSLYNETPAGAVYPTPVIGMVGIIENIENLVTMDFKEPGDRIILLGETRGHLGGSRYLTRLLGRPVGPPPAVDLTRELALQRVSLAAAARGLLKSAHDVGEGGLAVAVTECTLGQALGAEIRLPDHLRADQALFAEDQGRMLVSVDPAKAGHLLALAEQHQLPAAVVGTVRKDGLVTFRHRDRAIIACSVDRLQTRYREAIPWTMD